MPLFASGVLLAAATPWLGPLALAGVALLPIAMAIHRVVATVGRAYRPRRDPPEHCLLAHLQPFFALPCPLGYQLAKSVGCGDGLGLGVYRR